ncbi:MAG: 50S ribosomal protein L3, partial [Bacteroidales bacterium]|nr:50S ribosomal protein L3 [Bacteroidales bacterium]
MTNIFDDKGKSVPVTVIEAGPCHVIQVKTKVTDGYDAIQIGFGLKRDKLVNSPDKGRFKKAGVSAVRYCRELRVKDAAVYKLGQKIEADIFAKG